MKMRLKPIFCNVEEAAALLGQTQEQVLRSIAEGRLHAIETKRYGHVLRRYQIMKMRDGHDNPAAIASPGDPDANAFAWAKLNGHVDERRPRTKELPIVDPCSLAEAAKLLRTDLKHIRRLINRGVLSSQSDVLNGVRQHVVCRRQVMQQPVQPGWHKTQPDPSLSIGERVERITNAVLLTMSVLVAVLTIAVLWISEGFVNMAMVLAVTGIVVSCVYTLLRFFRVMLLTVISDFGHRDDDHRR